MGVTGEPTVPGRCSTGITAGALVTITHGFSASNYTIVHTVVIDTNGPLGWAERLSWAEGSLRVEKVGDKPLQPPLPLK